MGEVTARLLAAVVGVVAAAEPRHRGLALQLAGLFPRQGKALQAVMARATTRPGALVAAAAELMLSAVQAQVVPALAMVETVATEQRRSMARPMAAAVVAAVSAALELAATVVQVAVETVKGRGVVRNRLAEPIRAAAAVLATVSAEWRAGPGL